jgi:hypothetical protein
MPPNNVVPFPARATAKAKPPGPQGASPHGGGGKVVDLTDVQVRELSLDLLQLALDLGGIADPTPTCDGASALIAITRGNWLDAVISGVSMVPYVGDLAKTGKLPKYLKSLEKAVDLARRSEKVAAALTPAFQKLKQGLDLLPRGANASIDRMKNLVETFLRSRGAVKVAQVLPDISKQFKLYTQKFPGKDHKIAEGWLGVPGHVKTHRSKSQQRKVSSGTGDDAGHLIGDQFGAPGDARNLSLQNWRANQGGGTFHDLEGRWADKLQKGYKIRVKVTDIADAGNPRPYHRQVEWIEVAPDGRTQMKRRLDFVNTHTEKSRAAQGITSNLPPGHTADVIPIKRGN